MELDFWGLDTSGMVLQDLKSIFDSEPLKVHQNVLNKWRQLGPFDLQKLKDQVNFDKNLLIKTMLNFQISNHA